MRLVQTRLPPHHYRFPSPQGGGFSYWRTEKGRPYEGRPSVELDLGQRTSLWSSSGPALSEVEGSRIHPVQLAGYPVHAERDVEAVLGPDGQVVYDKITNLRCYATLLQPKVNAHDQLGRGDAEETGSRW